MGQHGEGWPLGRLVLHAGEVLLRRRLIPSAYDGGFRKGPREMGLTDRGACSARACAVGLLGTRDQAARGDPILAPGDALETVDCIEQHKAEPRATTRHGLQQRPRVGVMVLGGGEEREGNSTKQRIIGGEKRQSDLEALLDGGIGAAFGNALTGGVVGQLCADRREVRLAMGLVDRRQERGPFVGPRPAAPHESTGGAPLGGRDRGLREPPATEQGGNLVGIELVMFGLPPRDGFHGEGMAEDTRDPCIGTEVGEPGPGAQTCDGDDETVSRRGNGLEKGFRIRRHGTVKQRLTGLVEEADVHGTGRQVDTAGQGVVRRVKSP